MKIAITSGGYDPLHPGHIESFSAALKRYDFLIVGVNSDDWLVRKKGIAFMPLLDRMTVVRSCCFVTHVQSFDDSDGTAKALIRDVSEKFRGRDYDLVFCKGGDRKPENTPEYELRNEIPRLTFDFDCGPKIASSSDYLRRYLEHHR